jgi:hypothetical protein
VNPVVVNRLRASKGVMMSLSLLDRREVLVVVLLLLLQVDIPLLLVVAGGSASSSSVAEALRTEELEVDVFLAIIRLLLYTLLLIFA